jgi:hypothetical protein
LFDIAFAPVRMRMEVHSCMFGHCFNNLISNCLISSDRKKMSTRQSLGKAFLLLSLVPLGFLVYTLLNLEPLGISLFHPRMIVEFSFVCIVCFTWDLANSPFFLFGRARPRATRVERRRHCSGDSWKVHSVSYPKSV